MKKLVFIFLLVASLAPRCEAAFASSSTFMDAIAVYYARKSISITTLKPMTEEEMGEMDRREIWI